MYIVITIDALCAAWKLAPILTSWKPDAGTIHSTLLFKTTNGAYALRAYRYSADERWRIECEHALIVYATSQGLPAITPLPLPNWRNYL